MESEEVTTPEEIFVDAHEEDEEVFLEAIQTEERESYLLPLPSLSSSGNDESTWCVTDRERPALPSFPSLPSRSTCVAAHCTGAAAADAVAVVGGSIFLRLQ